MATTEDKILEPTAEAAKEELLRETPGILERFARAIDRAMSAEVKRTGWELTAYMLLDTWGGQVLIAGPKLITKLKAWQERYDRALASINSHTQPEAKKAWLAHSQTLTEASGAGTVAQHEGWTLEDFEQDFDQKVQAAKSEMRRVYVECLPTCQEISERFISIGTRKVAAMEDAERERHENFGVQFSAPSNLIRTFRKTIEIAGYRTQQMDSGSISPKSMLPYLDF